MTENNTPSSAGFHQYLEDDDDDDFVDAPPTKKFNTEVEGCMLLFLNLL